MQPDVKVSSIRVEPHPSLRFGLQDGPNRLTVAQGHGPGQLVADLHLRIDAQAMIDRGDDVRGGDGVGRRVGGIAVTGAMDDPALDAAAGEDAGEAVRPVVAAVLAGPGTTNHRLPDSRGATH